jgi:hypothetical protein
LITSQTSGKHGFIGVWHADDRCPGTRLNSHDVTVTATGRVVQRAVTTAEHALAQREVGGGSCLNQAGFWCATIAPIKGDLVACARSESTRSAPVLVHVDPAGVSGVNVAEADNSGALTIHVQRRNDRCCCE